MALSPQTIDRLKAQLLTSGLSQQNAPLFQIINLLIDALRQVTIEAQATSGSSGSISGATVLTEGIETGTFPNSRQVLPGAGIQFNDGIPGRRVISTALPLSIDENNDSDYALIGMSDVQGPIGPQGSAGMPGFDGIDGVDGLDSFIPGPAGSNGEQGIQGLIGPPGLDGEEGLEGLPGLIGLTGPIGIAGINGINGLDGEDGLDGLMGPSGPVGLAGSQGIMGPPGLDGEVELLETLIMFGSTGQCCGPFSSIFNAPATAVVTTTSAQVVASNPNRKGLVLTNLSNDTMFFGIGSPAVLDSGIALRPDGVWVMDAFTFGTAAVNAIADGGGTNRLAIQELQ